MKKNYTCVLFDLDGTLIDTSPGIFKSIAAAADECGVPCPSDLTSFIGPPIEYAAAHFLHLAGKALERFVAVFRENYVTNHLFDAKPYEGITDLLASLNACNITCGIATNKRDDYAQALIKHFKLDTYFAVIKGAGSGLSKADLIRSCMDEAGADAEMTLYIGDTQYDADAAQDAGIDFMGVAYGFGFKQGEMPINDIRDLSNLCKKRSYIKNEQTYDLLLIGAGLFSSVIAYEAKKRNQRTLIIEKRPHIGGNIYTQSIQNIMVHQYGAHIFHTDNPQTYRYFTQFAEFNHFVNCPLANYNRRLYNLPFNMNTFYQLWGCVTPDEARAMLEQQKKTFSEPKNLEEQALSLVGSDIYERLIKGYTEKQWGRKCSDLPAFIIKRIPIRFTYDNNYFADRYQGIPIGGYTQIIEKMLDGVEIILNVDYLTNRQDFKNIANKVIFTGQIDAYFDYCLGALAYRSLRFEYETMDISNYQGVAVMNFTDSETPFTRVIEHKHFTFGQQPNTVVTREYPAEWKKGAEPYYPVNNEANQKLYETYSALAQNEVGVIFGGRLGEYKYYDMDEVIEAALALCEKIF